MGANSVDGERLVEECAAFLGGSWLAERSDPGTRAPVPAWAWLNALAHGSLRLVLAVEHLAGCEPSGSGDAWGALAAQLLHHVQNGDRDLADLQRRVLIPAELDLLGGRFGPRAIAAPAAISAALARASRVPDRC